MKQQVREGFHARSALGTAATLPDLLSIDMIDDIAKQEPDFLRKMIEPLLKNFCERFFNLIETWRTSFQFLLEDPAMKKKNNSFSLIIKMLVPLLHQQLVLAVFL